MVATDINNDGNMDLFVANDTVANFLLVNDGKGKFRDIGVEAGIAYSEDGSPRSGMGVDSADYDLSLIHISKPRRFARSPSAECLPRPPCSPS